MVNSSSDINVVFICDNNYVKPTIIAITSLICNKSYEDVYKINILTTGLENSNIVLLKKLETTGIKINIIDQTERVDEFLNIDQNRHVTPAAILKFYIPQIFPNLHKILYLDSDILIQGSLKPLYDMDLQNYYAAVVKDILCKLNRKHMQKLGINNEFYFNTGVMLLNLDKLREYNITKLLVDFRLSRQNFFMDQDAFNAIIGDNVKFISYKYNFLNYYLEKMKPRELSEFFNERFSLLSILIYRKCCIIHLGGPKKPWVYNIGYLSILYKKYWKKSILQKETLKLKKLDNSCNFFEYIFSVKNDKDNKHKKIRVLGVTIKLKKTNNKNNKIYLVDEKQNRKKVKKIKGLTVIFSGKNGIVEIGCNPLIKFKNAKIYAGNNAYVSIGSSKYQANFNIVALSDNSKVIIGDDFSCEKMYLANRDEPNLRIEVGKDCMFSSEIYIRSSDGHTIVDLDKNVINKPNDIKIGDHVWVCNSAKILKNVQIPDNCIVANSAIVTGVFQESNCIIAGLPAKIIKRNVNWDRKNTYKFKRG